MEARHGRVTNVPTWLLQFTVTMSKISSLRLKVIATQVLKSLCGEEPDWAKVTKITTEAKIDKDGTKSVIDGIEYLLVNSARFDTDDKVAAHEMTMLGLPKESADALSRVYATYKDKLREVLAAKTISLPTVKDTQWRTDHVVCTNKSENPNTQIISMNLVLDNGKNVNMELTVDKFRALYNELRGAKEMMDKIEG
eukprot:TRINITY_DN67972_c9_g1_i4.p1 TRINITY_DN67972_c9_g1~~TRINITY_DN67972_c9_g1_i4.p1  ORF type:complete len:205 (+),score=11.81 TRINITY_DN67972_c9_g1_i4:30-617(+)